jgi:hypothetical protein
MNNNAQHDPLAHASATPDVSALITEFTYALDNGPAQVDTLAAGEDTRFNRWPGKSPNKDGVLRQINQPQGKTVKPYDNRPDTDVNLADEIVLSETDIDMFAFQMAQEGAETTHINQMTAAQVAEARAMLKWIRKATAAHAIDGAELLSQMKGSIGWAVLQSGWREKWGLVERTVTMDEVFQAANMAQRAMGLIPGSAAGSAAPTGGAPGGTSAMLAMLPQLIMDETLEDQAVEVVQMFLPHLKKSKVTAIVRDLRSEGEATFLDRQLEFKGPYLETLIPGVNVFVSGGTGDPQKARGWLRIEFFYQAELESMATAGWNEEFIELAKTTAGMVTNQGKSLRNNNAAEDAHERRIEIWTTEVRQFDEETGAAGIYCTTFSPHLSPTNHVSETPTSFYATHYLLDSAHGQYPYDLCRREVIGPALDDSRGVPHMVRADQNQIKLHQDSLAMRAQWEVNPAIVKVGSGWSKIREPLAPGSEVTLPPGGDAKAFALDRGNPQVGEAIIERIERGSRRRFALPNNGQEGDHPSLWQMRQARQTSRFLNCYRGAYWKLLVLCYQEFTPAEIAQIIGRPPLLTLPDLLRCQVTLKFEPRSLDSDWTETVLKFITQIMTWDKGGLIDTAPLMRIGLSYIDTTIIDEVLRSPQGAQAQLYRKVEQDVSSIVLGNPPPLVEMDASAGMQMQMAFAVIGKNKKYQQALANDPQAADNLKTYFENLQHSQQETELSPVQGRLGVAEMPQKPVTKGNSYA